MDTVFGLPSHPLFVHAPVVLMPLAALAALALAIRPRWRRQSSIALAVGAAVVLVSTQLAIQSGNSFDELVGDAVDTSDHESLALASRNLIVLFLISSVATAVFDFRIRGRESGGEVSEGPAPKVLAAVTALLAVLATVWIARTGDEGARLVWDGVIPN